ncbi:hypothetical protein H2201_000625 [Coniosporium apollinis]|uniref:3'-5' exonuclease domain-containing protein n=2 Tax=Coniosporium TaxID=2810619 RepID=A0ABQ9P5A0_9PEZI|nr:hypothetical protein H2199_002585 [Cladosporium sp. JES 115]KAJ9669273.1 hypothetical protein H2201_000625 [Coniosporium apollinis]
MNAVNTTPERSAVAQFPEVLSKYKYTRVETRQDVVNFINKLVDLGMCDKPRSPSWSSVATMLGSNTVLNPDHREAAAAYRPRTFADLNSPHSIASSMPALYLDCEGVNLSREGSLTVLEIMSVLENRVYLFDILVLGKDAFQTPGKNGITLQAIPEDAKITKAFFDVRNDCDALHHHFGIKLQGIQDIQLMELATRDYSFRRLASLANCIDDVTRNSALSTTERKALQAVKATGKAILRREGFKLFAERPLLPELVMYCIVDVALLPMIWTGYSRKITKKGWEKMLEITARRIESSEHPGYEPNGPGRSLADWGFKGLMTANWQWADPRNEPRRNYESYL